MYSNSECMTKQDFLMIVVIILPLNENLSLQNAQRDTNNCAITPTSHLGQNVGLGEGQVGSFPKKDTMILSLLVCPLRQFRSQKETGAS